MAACIRIITFAGHSGRPGRVPALGYGIKHHAYNQYSNDYHDFFHLVSPSFCRKFVGYPWIFWNIHINILSPPSSKINYNNILFHQNSFSWAHTIVEWSVIIVDFGERLKQLRTQAGYTQAQLAQQIGVTKSVISFYELRERAPSPDVLVKLSGIFHVTTDYLLCIEKASQLDISGLTESQVTAVRSIVLEYQKANKA